MCLAVPGKVLQIEDGPLGMPVGRVSFGGVAREVCLAYTPEVQVGDYVLVHVGFAISRLDEAEARQVFEYLEEIARLGDLESPPGERPESEPASESEE